MPLYEFFKNLFGFPRIQEERTENKYSNDSNGNDYRSQFLNPDRGFEDMWTPHNEENPDNITQFNMFTDPLEMHRYFEQQMNELLKSFGFGSEDNNSLFGFTDLPALEPPQNNQEPSSNLRDHFLKPGYHSTENNTTDSDLDGRVHASDLDSFLKNKPSNDRSVVPRQESFLPQIRTFGQSITSKTVRNPDGTIETHRTVRDNAGNEETTITRKIGDKQYTVTIRTDKNGRQEKIEDMINIDDQEISRFTEKWQQPQSPQGPQRFDPNWFENMFK